MTNERIAALLILGGAWLSDELLIERHTDENLKTISDALRDVDVIRSQRDGLIALVPSKAEKYQTDFYGELLKIAAQIKPLFEDELQDQLKLT